MRRVVRAALVPLALAGCSKDEGAATATAVAHEAAVVVDGDGVSVDGARLAAAPTKLEMIHSLRDELARKRARWLAVHPTEPFPSIASVALPVGASCFAALSVVTTTAAAGYLHQTLAVGPERHVLSFTPPPLRTFGADEKEPVQLYLRFLHGGSVEVRRDGCLAPYDIVPVDRLAATARELLATTPLRAVSVGCEEGVPFADVLAGYTTLKAAVSAPEPILGFQATGSCAGGSTLALFEGPGPPFDAKPSPLADLYPSPSSTEPGWGPPPRPTLPVPLPSGFAGRMTEGSLEVAMPPGDHAVRSALDGSRDGLLGCYAGALTTHAKLALRVSARVVFGRRGAVVEQPVLTSDSPERALLGCIRERLAHLDLHTRLERATAAAFTLVFASGP